MNEDWVGEEVLDIDSPDLPDALRKQGNLFKNKARYVIDLGGGEYVLYAKNGELLDAVLNCF